MPFLRRKFLILDCQTTGTSPTRDHLLEIGWVWVENGEWNPEPKSLLLQIPQKLPRTVTELTGITEKDAQEGLKPAEAFARFRGELGESAGALALAHYAQFERGFLEKFFSAHGDVFHLKLLCSYRIAQRLFPEAPSRNIRGLVGYLGCEFAELRRASDHVRATALIWSRMISELENIGINSMEALEGWLQEKPKKASKSKLQVAFPLSREKRLSLPKTPGIYRMLSKNGEVLYIGKATTLHSRVNSYFRGGVAGDPRKLEMLARVYDIDVRECSSPLEAALLENEEIKAHAPKYNLALRPSARTLSFFSRNFGEVSSVQDNAHPVGPFREGSSLHDLFDFLRGIGQGQMVDVFFDLVTEDALKEGFTLFMAREGFAPGPPPPLRALLAIGMREYREWLKQKALTEEKEECEDEAEKNGEAESEKQTEIITPEEVSDKFLRLCARAAEELRRSKRLGQLLNSEISWEARPKAWHKLSVRNGKILAASMPESTEFHPGNPWQGLKIEDFERMSVLLSELKKFPHRIEPKRI